MFFAKVCLMFFDRGIRFLMPISLPSFIFFPTISLWLKILGKYSHFSNFAQKNKKFRQKLLKETKI
jgi:hypothetical protein